MVEERGDEKVFSNHMIKKRDFSDCVARKRHCEEVL